MSRVMSITGALTAAILTAAQGALAQDSPWYRPSTGVSSRADSGASALDTTYIRQALRGNFLQVALGRKAESKATDSAVKAFAQRMISEHNSMNQEWGTLAGKHGMRFELEVDSAGRESAERLDDLSGPAFDQAYMAEMIQHHEQDQATFQRMGRSARAPEVRELANSEVTAIRQHLALAREVGNRVGVSTTAGRAGGVTPSDDPRRRTSDDRVNRDERDDRNDLRPLRAEDRVFVDQILSDHRMHVRLAKRAQREAKSDEVRRLAERMEKEFTQWEKRWLNFADRRDAKVDSDLERQHREKLERLDKASERKDFDRAYAAIVAEHLEALVDDFREEKQEKRPAAVGRLVSEELPVIRELQARARRLEKQASERAKDSDKN